MVSCLVIFCPTYFTTFETNQIKEKQRHVSRFYAHYQNNKCSGKDESCKSRDSMIHRGMDWKYKRYQRSYIQKSYSRIVQKFLIHKDNILGLIRPNFCSKKESFDERPLSPGLINDYDSKTFVQIERQKTNWYRGSNWRFQKWMTNLI